MIIRNFVRILTNCIKKHINYDLKMLQMNILTLITKKKKWINPKKLRNLFEKKTRKQKEWTKWSLGYFFSLFHFTIVCIGKKVWCGSIWMKIARSYWNIMTGKKLKRFKIDWSLRKKIMWCDIFICFLINFYFKSEKIHL
jgi:hypothetical protein